jgi:hypothetical protein
MHWSESLPPDPREPESAFDFYRCDRCRRIITAIEERRVLATKPLEDSTETATICECGSRRYSPTNPVGKPPLDLDPGAGKELTEEVARREFDRAFAVATKEWQDERVLEFAWLRYRGLA